MKIAIDQHSPDYLPPAAVGARLRSLREERGIAQKQLAADIGMEPAALSRVETGKRSMAIGELVLIAERLGVASDDLLLASPDPAPLYRNDGGDDVARTAVAEMSSIVDDFLGFRSVVGD